VSAAGYSLGAYIYFGAQTIKSHFLAEWSGINALIYYGPLLMRNLGLNGSTVNLLVAGGINIVQFLAVFPAILYIDRWGR
jgi:Sugar (and other) transporter